MADTGTKAVARRRAKAIAEGRKEQAPRGMALPFDRSLAHLCWQIGLSHERTAWVMKRSVGEVRHEWSVLTGLPLEDDPTEAEVERITAEIRAGWSPEVFSAAARGIRHQSDRMHKGEDECKATTSAPGTGKRPGPLRECSRSTALQPSR